MKKSLITIALLGTIITASAQTKQPETKPIKPQYQKVVVIPVQDYQTLTEALNQSKATVIYQPGLDPAQAVNIQKQIDAYLSELPKRVKLDSIKVEGK